MGERPSEMEINGISISETVHIDPRNVHVEVCVKKSSQRQQVEEGWGELVAALAHTATRIFNWKSFTPNAEKSSPSRGEWWIDAVERLRIGVPALAEGAELERDLLLPLLSSCPNVHSYSLIHGLGAMPQELGSTEDDNGDGSPAGGIIASHQWELPCKEFEPSWDQLYYGDELKVELLFYTNSLLKLAELGADPAVLAMNRIVLLHGPPGTGKTTLCKALAQRLSVMMGKHFRRSIFVEVNSHSLFSKWFSESGKLVAKLFERVTQLAECNDHFVYVLVDEVESLTMGRSAAFSGGDPSDSLRAVNAVLTQLDRLGRNHPNVMVLATSNISTALDPAFVDRADLNRYVGPPTAAAIRRMLDSAIDELTRVGAITGSDDGSHAIYENKLQEIASVCATRGMSGRSVRKIPILAFSKMASTKLDSLACLLDTIQRNVNAT